MNVLIKYNSSMSKTHKEKDFCQRFESGFGLVWIKEGSWKEGKIYRVPALRKKEKKFSFPWKTGGFYQRWKPLRGGLRRNLLQKKKKNSQNFFPFFWSSKNVPQFWILIQQISVADPGCLSRIPYPGSRIPDPDFCPSRIPDLGSRIPDPKIGRKERGEKNFLSNIFLQPQISQNVKLFNF